MGWLGRAGGDGWDGGDGDAAGVVVVGSGEEARLETDTRSAAGTTGPPAGGGVLTAVVEGVPVS